MLLSIAVAIPLALFQYQYFAWIPLDDFRLQFVIGSLVLLSAIYYLVLQIKYVVLIAIAGVVLFSLYQQHTGKQPISNDISTAYTSLLALAINNANGIISTAQVEQVESNQEELKAAADYMNPVVKTFANEAATTYFTENDDALFKQHQHNVRYFSVFKTVHSQWKYVGDPKNEEYFAKASESIKTMAGDCDDYNALMTACIKSIGGETQMVTVEGHIFPIVRVANSKFEFDVKVKPLVRQLFENEYNDEPLSIYNLKEKMGYG